MLPSKISLNFLDPTVIFEGTLVIVAPHMDDAVLACGGTISKLPRKDRIHIIYATDGSQSPQSILPHYQNRSKDLTKIRMEEAKEALQTLGVTEKNLHFFNFPDGKLNKYSRDFSESFISLIQQIKATHLLVPFEYDSHPDHLTVHHLTTKAIQKVTINDIKVFEYFVYYNLRMLPGGDLRKYVNPKWLYRVDIHDKCKQKRNALFCFRSQVTKFYDWQESPVLSQTIVDDVCRNQEVFVHRIYSQTSKRKEKLFIGYGNYIPAIHLLEPVLKKMKDKTIEAIKAVKNQS
jgi:LmbE family N-acetylglucosaminyl deacetylase